MIEFIYPKQFSTLLPVSKENERKNVSIKFRPSHDNTRNYLNIRNKSHKQNRNDEKGIESKLEDLMKLKRLKFQQEDRSLRNLENKSKKKSNSELSSRKSEKNHKLGFIYDMFQRQPCWKNEVLQQKLVKANIEKENKTNDSSMICAVEERENKKFTVRIKPRDISVLQPKGKNKISHNLLKKEQSQPNQIVLH